MNCVVKESIPEQGVDGQNGQEDVNDEESLVESLTKPSTRLEEYNCHNNGSLEND